MPEDSGKNTSRSAWTEEGVRWMIVTLLIPFAGVLVHRNHASQFGRFQDLGIGGWESESEGGGCGTDGARPR